MMEEGDGVAPRESLTLEPESTVRNRGRKRYIQVAI
jgi:hypothetical protein